MALPESHHSDPPTPRSETHLRYEDVQENGHLVTLARDSEGHVAYPAPVPPEANFPTSPTLETPPNLLDPAQPLPENEEDLQAAKSGPERPKPAGRRWPTDMPRRGDRRFSILPPAIKRAGTNVSELNRAFRGRRPAMEHNGGETTDSGSSSDDDDDDDDEDEEIGRRSAAKNRNRDQFRRFRVGNDDYQTKGRVSKKDGRLRISLQDTSNTGYLAKALGMAVKKVLPTETKGGLSQDNGEAAKGRPSATRLSSTSTTAGLDNISCPRLNIVIMVIGSRGDAQPFLKIGKVLKEQYGHRVRIATHPAFRDFVERDSGLEFFSVGGDPAELMAFMVKNPGMIPTLETVRAGDIGRRRAAMAEMFQGFWRACINASDDEKDLRNLKMMGERDPFIADAIIANPPSFAHIHCAEALGVPLHLMFTFPYTPTQAFPHPLASIKKSNVDPGYTNFISYPLVEMMVWQGLGDLVNDFRVKTLGLDAVSTLWAPGSTYRLHVPFTYLWSPALVPKPEDWGDEVDVSGFTFLDLASTFTPPESLTKFLEAGEAPVYIGFGSIVVDDPDRFTEMIFEAVQAAGVRALVSKGWGGLGGDSLSVPDNIYMLDNTPHDWLFPKVRACVIHGGAGTTAMALKCGLPTMIVPFFGDQHFWGSMVSNAKAGPEPVPYKDLTAEKLAAGIEYCLTEEAMQAAGRIARDIEREGDGAQNACRAFHKNLKLSGNHSMRCSLLEDRVAAWQLKNTNLRLSPLAADFLVDRGYVSWRRLRILRHNEWNDFEGPGEPLTGMAGSLVTSIGDVFRGIGGVPYRVAKVSNQRKEKKKKKKERKEEVRRRRQQQLEQLKTEKASKRTGQREGTHGVIREKNERGVSSSNHPPPSEARDHAIHSQALLSGETETDDGNRGRVHLDDREQSQTQEVSTGANGQTSSTNALHLSESCITSSTDADDNPVEEVAVQVGRGAFKSVAALARAPIDLSVALAQGFHNAPRLYGDDTVRRPPRVTGIQSGLRAGGREFVLGIYDGWTGLVRLPVRGVRGGGGARGLVTGVGMGVTGFVLKNLAAIIGPFGYTLKGVVKQVERSHQPFKYIRRARIMQGQREARQLSEEERRALQRAVLHGWEVMGALWEALEANEKKKGKGKNNRNKNNNGKEIEEEENGTRKRTRWRKRRTSIDGLGKGWLLGLRSRKRRSLGAAFESVEIAERALAALRRGENVETVVGKTPGRRSTDGGMGRVDAKKEREKVASRRRSEDTERGANGPSGVDDATDRIDYNGMMADGRAVGASDENGDKGKKKRISIVEPERPTRITEDDEEDGEDGDVDGDVDMDEGVNATFADAVGDTEDKTPVVERENPFLQSSREIKENMDENRRAEMEVGVKPSR